MLIRDEKMKKPFLSLLSCLLFLTKKINNNQKINGDTDESSLNSNKRVGKQSY